MEEIEVGEYVKLNYGKIDKVKNNDLTARILQSQKILNIIEGEKK